MVVNNWCIINIVQIHIDYIEYFQKWITYFKLNDVVTTCMSHVLGHNIMKHARSINVT